MPANRTRAGSRTERYRRAGYGKLHKNRIAFLRTVVTNQLALNKLNPDDVLEEDDPLREVKIQEAEKGENYLLLIPVPGRRNPLVWNICAMTTEELEATREFFNYLFDLADPIIRERDKVAEDAFSKGDDSFVRSYRQLPQLVIRSRQERTDDQGVLDGSEDAAEGDAAD